MRAQPLTRFVDVSLIIVNFNAGEYLAGAVDSARVTSDGKVVTVSFSADAQALAKYAGSAAVRSALEDACETVHPGVVEIKVEVETGPDRAEESESGLMAAVESDPGVALVREIIGGEIVEVRPDGGG